MKASSANTTGRGIVEEPELTDMGDDLGDEGFWDV